jgi:outer membrane lipoprotein LolB
VKYPLLAAPLAPVFAVFALLAMPLAGCTSLAPNEPSAMGWTGKLGYRVEASASQRIQAGSVSFDLQGTAQLGSLTLTGPLGTTVAKGDWDRDGARLFDGQQTQTHPSLAELGAALGRALHGAPLPLEALFDWIQGRPWPQAPSELLANGGWQQLGWQVQHESKGRLIISRPTQDTMGAIQIRLVLTAP